MSRRIAEMAFALLLATGSLFSAARAAQQPPVPGPQDLVGPIGLALPALAVPAGAPRLTVTSTAFGDGAAIPDKHSDYGEKISPPLRWTGVPPAARTLVLLVEDPDAKEPKPFVHWVLYNMADTRTELPPAVAGLPKLTQLEGALQGRGSHGHTGYVGPHPPKADPPHHYHFQLFALDTTLTLDPNASRAKVLDAMKGHVVAAGELVGTFKAPADAK
jgi:Raf kinase inhibitor-like YbhB/YbcL family protein